MSTIRLNFCGLLLVFSSFAATAKPKNDTASLYERKKKAVLKIIISKAGFPLRFGTGFYSKMPGSKSTVIVTNRHVIFPGLSEGGDITVLNSDGQKVSFDKLLGFDQTDVDISFLSLEGNKLPNALETFSPKHDPSPGDNVYVIGHPGGMDYSITSGLISGPFRKGYKDIRYLQLSAAISPGNSGGPLFDSSGNVLGVTTLQARGVEYQNLNFAIYWPEVEALYKKVTEQSKSFTLAEAQALYQTKVKEESDVFAQKILTPSLEGFQKEKKLPKDFRQFTLASPNRSYWMAQYNPHIVKCSSQSTKTFFSLACPVPELSSEMVGRIESGNLDALRKYFKNNPKSDYIKQVATHPLFEDVLATLADDKKKLLLNAVPESSEMRKIHREIVYSDCKSESDHYSCQLQVLNDGAPGVSSRGFVYQHEGDNNIVSVVFKTADSARLDALKILSKITELSMTAKPRISTPAR